MKEMEARRQQILQRKLDEDKAREEKRLKEESDKKKREETEKRMFRPPIKKVNFLVFTYPRRLRSDSSDY